MKWLHISDIHYSPKTDGNAKTIRDELLKYIGDHGLYANEIFFTGDYRHAVFQKDEDIHDAAKSAVSFMREIADSAEVKGTDHIHIIPGNHDLSRISKTEEERKKRYNSIRRKYDHQHGAFIKADLDFLLERFDFFDCVCEELYGDASPWRTDKPYTYKNIGEYILLCLNSAIFHENKKDRGKLIIGNSYVSRALDEIQEEYQDKPIIVLAHHGLDYLIKQEKDKLEQLFSRNPVKLYLCGDAHEVTCRKLYSFLEITMGCLQSEKGVQAAFCYGDTDKKTIEAYEWDFTFGRWVPYTGFNDTIKELDIDLANGEEFIPYRHSLDCFLGRDGFVNDNLPLIKVNQITAIHGAPGIGKTEVCYEMLNRLHADGWNSILIKLQGKNGSTGLISALCE